MAHPIVAVDKEAPVTIVLAKEQLIKVKVKKGGEKGAPKKRDLKQATKQSKFFKKDTVSDEGVDVND